MTQYKTAAMCTEDLDNKKLRKLLSLFLSRIIENKKLDFVELLNIRLRKSDHNVRDPDSVPPFTPLCQYYDSKMTAINFFDTKW